MKEIVYTHTSELTHYDRNPRSIAKDQFEKLCANIKADPGFFESRPLLVNEIDGKRIVYAGNQRLRAAKKLKLVSVPCIIERNLDPELVKKRIILDNITHGEFDFDMLAADFDALELLDMGMPESTLDLFAEESKEPAAKKPKVCPHCGEKL